MWTKVLRTAKAFSILGCVLALLAPPVSAKIQEKSMSSLVVPNQGILPGSRITEVVRLDVVETDTRTPDNPVDDGGAILESLTVSFTKMANTEVSELSTVAVYEIGQPIDEQTFNYDKEFSFGSNILHARKTIDSPMVVFEDLNIEILNTRKRFFIAIATDISMDDDDEFAIRVSDVVLTHPAASDPFPNLRVNSDVLTCVDFAGDLMPMPDVIRSQLPEIDYPFSPHNYPDYSTQHPDALDDLQDLEIPQVVPAESTATVVLGFEMAGVRSDLSAVRLNFTSTIDGVNNDKDYFIDEDLYVMSGGVPIEVSRRGIFDPYVDEIVRDNDGDGYFSAGDTVLYPGYNGVMDADRRGVDDDGDGTIDEEKRNLFRYLEDNYSLYEVNEDKDFFVDKDGDGLPRLSADEVYRDYDGDGKYASSTALDVLLVYAGVRYGSTGVQTGMLREGVSLSAFPADSTAAFTNTDGDGEFDPLTDVLLYDLDQNGILLVLPDTVIDFDGDISPGPGDDFYRDVSVGGTGRAFKPTDRVYTDSATDPSIVWQDNEFSRDGLPTEDDRILILPPAGLPSGTDTSIYIDVSEIDSWRYYDRNRNETFNVAEDIWVNLVTEQPEFNHRSEVDSEWIIFEGELAGTLVDGATLAPASVDDQLKFFDTNDNENFDSADAVVLEPDRGGSYTVRGELVSTGGGGGASLSPGDVYDSPSTPTVAMIDEDHGQHVLHPLVDEDMQDRVAYLEEDGVPGFSIIDLDGDGDYFPINEDLNGNGILDRIDNNGDGDFDDQDDYTEDINGDGQLDLGIEGDEIYIDYDGDGNFDPDVGGQLTRVTELYYEGVTPNASLRTAARYENFLKIDEDGDGERGGATLDSLVAISLGLVSPIPPFTSGIDIPMADGVDNDGDGLVDEGINEDLGDTAFDAITLYNIQDRDFSNDILVSDIERILLYKDNPENPNGRFDQNEDILISRHDPGAVSWQWIDITPPTYTAEIFVSLQGPDEELLRKWRRLPVTDNHTYDYFIVVHTDGDDDGDIFDYDGGQIEMYDGFGLRHGDDFQISLARDGIITSGGKPNAKEITKPIESVLHMDDMIGFVSSSVQGESQGVGQSPSGDPFIGNPYFDATSSPIAVLGLNVSNSPIPVGDGTYQNDVLEQVRVFLQRIENDELDGSIVEGTFDIVQDGNVVTLPDLMPLADDSSGGVGIYRDDNTPEGDGIDNDDDGLIDEELLNGLDDDGDGLIDEDVGDDDPAGIPGVFDQFDDPLLLRNDTGSPLSYRMLPGATDTAFVDLNLMSGAMSPPDDEQSFTAGYDYYIVLRTSDGIDYRDTWRVYVEDQGVRFRGGRSTMNTGVDTDSIASNVPVFYSDLTRPEPSNDVQTIQANSEPVGVVGINLYDRNGTDGGRPASLEYIKVTIENVGADNDFTPSDLLPIATVEDLNGNGVFDAGEVDWNGDGIPNSGKDSGVAIYRDSTDPDGKPGVFDDTDELIYLDGDEYFGNLFGFPNTVQLNLDRFGDQDGEYYERIPADDLGDNKGPDYFVVIRTSSAVSNGDDFRVRVSPVVANEIVQWPMHFRPRETNGIFEYTYSYEAIVTNILRANTQTDAVFAGLVDIGQRIEADSLPTAVLGVNINDSGNQPPKRLNQIRLRIYPGEGEDTGDDAASGFTESDLNAFSNTVNSGLAIYRDVDGAGRNGVFDAGIDQRLNQTTSSYTPVYDGDQLRYVEAVINLSPGAELPDNELGENFGDDFYVVVRTSRSISFNDSFSVELSKDGLYFESGESLGNKTVLTKPLSSNVPVFFSDRTNIYARRVGTISEPRVAIGIDMNSRTQANPTTSNESIISMVVQFNRENDSTFTNGDIATLLRDSVDSGIALYRDLPGSDTLGNGRFNYEGDQQDLLIPLASQPYFQGENEIVLTLEQSSLTQIPAGVDADDFGADFFIVFRTSASITRDSEFSVTVKDIKFEELNSQLDYTTGVVKGSDVNQPPTVELITPRLGDRASSEPFTILWEGADDGEASVDLYYMDEGAFTESGIIQPNDVLTLQLSELPMLVSEDGTVANDIPLGESNSFAWDITRVPIGDKRVIAIVTDEKKLRGGSFSPGSLSISNELPTFFFVEPNGEGDAVVQGTPFFIAWEDSDPENNASIELFLRTFVDDATEEIALAGGESLFEDPDGQDDLFEVATDDLAAGTYYPVARFSDGVKRDGEIPVFEVQSATPFVVLTNVPPQMTFLTPTEADQDKVIGTNVFDIEWEDRDDDSEAIISLFYGPKKNSLQGLIPIEQTNQTASGILYATGIPEGTGIEGEPGADDFQDSFRWDITNVTPGVYYLSATIDDGVNPARNIFSEYSLTIDKKPSFKFLRPTGEGDQLIAGATYELIWEAYDPDSDAQIDLYLETSRPAPGAPPEILENPIASGISEDDAGMLAISTAGLEPGSYYPAAVISDENNPPQTVFADAALVILENALPAITLLTPSETGAVAFGDTFEIRWIDANRDSEAGDEAFINLYYDTDNRELNGVKINSTPIRQDEATDLFLWNFKESDIQAGSYYLYATIEDSAKKVVFDYSEGPVIIPESDTNFFYGMHLLSSKGETKSLDTTEPRTFDLDFDFEQAVSCEASPDGRLLLVAGEDGEVKAASAGQVLTEAEQDELGFERWAFSLTSHIELPVGDRKVIDLEFDVKGNGYYLLDNYGTLYASAGVMDELVTEGPDGLFGFDIARDLEITSSARGGYILTGDGGVVPLGDAPTLSTPYFGWDIARDIELVQGGYYLLDGLGGVYAIGADVPSFASPWYGVDKAIDLIAIDEGGYFILYEGGLMAVGGNRLNLPSDSPTTPLYETGIEDLIDLSLSGDIMALFSEDLISKSVERFVAAVKQENLQGVSDELSEEYSDSDAASKSAKVRQFQQVFNNPNLDTSQFILQNIEVTLGDDAQSAVITGDTQVSSTEITYTTQSLDIDRNGVPDDGDYTTSTIYISTRNEITPAMEFNLESDQEVIFRRKGDPEYLHLYLDVKPGEYAPWEPVNSFGLNKHEETTFDLEGGEGYQYRVIVVDMNNQFSLLTEPLYVYFTYSESSTEEEDYEVFFQYSQDAPGDWAINSVNLPPDSWIE